MKQYVFAMGLSAYKLEDYYRGNVKNVLVTTLEGLRLQLPLDVFRPYVTNSGIHGAFTVIVDENNKLIRIEKQN